MKIKKISVLGAGTLGLGIIHVGAMGGLEVIGYDVSRESLDKADRTIRKNMSKPVELGKAQADDC